MHGSRCSVAMALALVCALAGTARADDVARSPHGVEVDIPAGYRWRPDHKPSPTSSTIIYLEGTGGGSHPPVILVNHAITTGATEADVFAEARSIGQTPEDSTEVTMPNGKFVRVDFSVEIPPRIVRQRCYVTLRGKHIYSFFLANLDAKGFEQHVGAFDALMGTARFFEPTPPPVAQAPRPADAPGKPPADGAPPSLPLQAGATPPPEPTRPPQPAPPRPAQPQNPPPASPQPPTPQPSTPQPGQPAAPPPTQPPPPRPGAPPAPTSATQEEVLGKAALVRMDGEFDPDVWAARNLTDGRADRGWCSPPAQPAPFRFVWELKAPARIERLVLDDACPEEQGFEGCAAREVQVEGSTEGPERGFRPLAQGALVAGKNGQELAVSDPAPVRWLRLVVRSNHGHAQHTELMEVRAFARALAAGLPSAAPALPAPPPAFHLVDPVRASRERGGAALGEGEALRPGERLWLALKPRRQARDGEGKGWLEVDLVLEDAQGRELLRRDKVVDHVAAPPAPPLAPVIHVHLDLPAAFPAGTFTVRLIARDRVAGTSAAALARFTVVR